MNFKGLCLLTMTLLLSQTLRAQVLAEPCFDQRIRQIRGCQLDSNFPSEFKNYLKTQFPIEFKNALNLAHSTSGLTIRGELSFQFTYHTHNNGVAIGNTIRVLIAKNEPFNLMRFKNIFFHELGHVLYENYAINYSKAYRDYLKVSNSQDIPMITKMNTMNAHAMVYKPASELMADLFRVIFLQDPGFAASRNFANLSRINLDDVITEHDVYHPLRSYLWVNYLRRTIRDSRRNMLLFEDVANASLELLESRFGRELDSLLNGKIEEEVTPRTLNRELANLLGIDLRI